MSKSRFHNIAVDNISKIISHFKRNKMVNFKTLYGGCWNICNSGLLDVVNIEQTVLVYSYVKFKTK